MPRSDCRCDALPAAGAADPHRSAALGTVPRTALGPAIVAVVIAGMSLATMDAIGKYLSGSLPVTQILWARYTFHTLIVAAWLLVAMGPACLQTRRPLVQGVRAALMFAATTFMYFGIKYVPLADATALQFFSPVLVTLLAGVVLKEHVGPRRLAAVAIGFVGVLVIIRPGMREVHPAMFLPLGAAFCLSAYFVLTRRLAGIDDNRVTLLYTTLVGTFVLTAAMPLVWTAPAAWEWVGLVSLGLFGALGQMMLIRAFGLVPAAVLSPFLYAQLLSAVVLSILVFGDMPDAGMVAGTLMLVGSGLYIWYREAVLGRGRPTPPTASQ